VAALARVAAAIQAVLSLLNDNVCVVMAVEAVVIAVLTARMLQYVLKTVLQDSSLIQFLKTVLQEAFPHLDHCLALSSLYEVHQRVQSHHKQQRASQVTGCVVTSTGSLTAQ
jgi:hypothetical protein